MARRDLMFLSVAACLVMLSSSVSALLVTPLDLKHHIAQADVVLVGRVLNAESVGGVDRTVATSSVAFRIDRVLKGTAAVGSTIAIGYPTGYKHNVPEILSGYDLMLLRKVGDSYVFAQPPCSILPASEVTYSTYTASSNAEDNVRWEVLNSLKSPSAAIAVAALGQVLVLSKEDVDAYVKPLAANRDTAIQEAAIIALAKVGAVQPALGYLKVHPKDDLTEGPGGGIKLALALYARLGHADLPAATALLKSPSAPQRELATRLLRSSGDKAALPHLKSALGDADVRVRYNAVMGLAAILGDYGHAPAYDLFLANEKTYVGYWKTKVIP